MLFFKLEVLIRIYFEVRIGPVKSLCYSSGSVLVDDKFACPILYLLLRIDMTVE